MIHYSHDKDPCLTRVDYILICKCFRRPVCVFEAALYCIFGRRIKELTRKMLALLLLLLSLTAMCKCVKREYTAKYFSDVTMACDERTARQGAYPAFLKYWILPNQTTLLWSHVADGKHRLSFRPEYSLTVSRLDDDDFGTYHCVILWDNRYFIVDTIQVELLVDYGDIGQRYKRGAIAGSIGVGAIICTFLFIWLICYLMRSGSGEDDFAMDDMTEMQRLDEINDIKRRIQADEVKRLDEERRAVYELDKTVERFDDALVSHDEIALISGVQVIASNPEADHHVTTDADYATVSSAGKITVISDGSSGFYDNRVFDIENEGIVPYDESNSEMNFSQEMGDMFL